MLFQGVNFLQAFTLNEKVVEGENGGAWRLIFRVIKSCEYKMEILLRLLFHRSCPFFQNDCVCKPLTAGSNLIGNELRNMALAFFVVCYLNL